MPQDQQTYRRAANAALTGGFVQLALALAMTLIGLWARSPAVHAVVFHLYAGLPIWLILFLLYNQHRIERVEALEVDQLSRADTQTAAIFEEHADDLHLARRRLHVIQTWGLSVVSAVVALFLVITGSILAYKNYTLITTMQVTRQIRSADPGAPGPTPITQTVPISAEELNRIALSPDANPMALLFLSAAIAFVAFVVARYLAGMTKVKQWSVLRGGAGYLMGSSLLATLIFFGAGFALLEYRQVIAWLAVGVPLIMALIGAEILITFLLSAYRPRRPGEVPRPAFDSRMLGWLTNPESIASAINEAINYQFGFEVSRSWFYRLLARAITPLCAFGLVVLVLISSIVIVAPHEVGIVTTWGGSPREYAPGFHLKWPWPMGRVTHLPVHQVQQIQFGSAQGEVDHNRAILWTNPHGQGMEDFFTVPPSETIAARRAGVNPEEIVADEGDAQDEQARAKAPGTSLLGVQIVVQYRISDALAYTQAAAEPAKLLEKISEEAVSAYFVTRDLDTLLGEGRITAGDYLRKQIDDTAKAHNLGVEVLFVGLQGVHPPQESDVAAAFLKQIGALQDKQSAIEEAYRRRTEVLAGVAGSEERARRINAGIMKLDELRSVSAAAAPGSPERAEAEKAIAEQEEALERLLAQAGGEAAQAIYDAIAYRWRASVDAKAQADAFAARVTAHQHAPELYRAKLYYEALTEGLQNSRKYVVDPKAVGAQPVYRIDLKDQKSTLDDVLNLNQ